MSAVIPDSQSCHSLADWLCYIEHNHPVHKIELGLERVLEVAKRADLASLPGKTILIGGTNGKGTTACVLEQLLIAQGFRVGVYSSPHLLKFNERLRLDSQDVPDAAWLSAFAFIEQIRGEIALTYFEFTTLVAFRVLQLQQPDFCIIEVGLGGRLDATNIIAPDISVITTVDLDHQDWLGDNRELIGIEKAGIFRPGQPVVIGDLDPPRSVLAHAQQLACDYVLVHKDYRYTEQSESWQWQSQLHQFEPLPLPAMPVQNAACALAVLEKLSLLPDLAQLHNVLSFLQLPGRMQWLQQQPAVIIDVAHNPQSAAYLATQISKLKPQFKQIIALTGMLKDKDITQTLLPLTSLFDQWNLVSLEGARGATAAQLAVKLPQTNASVQLHDDVKQAYLDVSSKLQPDELLVVFGSFFTVSAVLAVHQEVK
ncbi:bifunctional tetrahydrofolate synthase/dihydrofolate synthase [Rheinheimera baltica]|uniref:bifunctional tetrahydrofolate synthase/dihydrofolate synthase n=1 Tax=Rheinheimera baltica TaxID=67576 RepID=UPI00273D2B5C|nr:bifunctional tetrahydrofolate synthase/dihydrofolate synthase [Rheinheimera baltica]MDP5191005.1 bifunctional tetrahydrofolate synthase/dihydrofolate synthase [Rheinheimera baltica]